MTGEVFVPQKTDFSVGKIDLNALQADLKKAQKEAVQKLVLLLKSEDEKIAADAAKALIKFGIDVAKEVSSDQLTRLIAQAKLSGPQALEPQSKYPMVDFDKVQDI